MSNTLARYRFEDLIAAVELAVQDISSTASASVPVSAQPATGFAIPTSAHTVAAPGYVSGLSAAGRANLVNLTEISAASKWIPANQNHAQWRDDWMFPIASAIALAPEHEPELLKVFDATNRRTADPAKATRLGYFESARTQLEHAVRKHREGVGNNGLHFIGFTRIFQVACDNGWDGSTGAQQLATTSLLKGGPFFSPVLFDAPHLHPVSWIVHTLLMRGDVTCIFGPGGSAKTAIAIHLLVGLAAGRGNIGPLTVNMRPGGLRVGIISGEEDENRIRLLAAAASDVLALGQTERAAVAANLVLHDARESGWRLGEPPNGSREPIASEQHDQSLSRLAEALTELKLDVIGLDTVSSLFCLPNENDNGLVTKLMNRLTRVARKFDCAMLVVHHSPKMMRETAALQRGEVTLARGGSAFTNSPRVALSMTPPLAAEEPALVMAGYNPALVRRFEHAKINDAPPMQPAFIEITSAKIQVRDGSDHAVRAVSFILPPIAATGGGGGGGISDAIRNVVMRTIDVGILDKHGAWVPLSPNGGGKDGYRNALPIIGRALTNVNSRLSEKQAKTLGRDVLNDLRQRFGSVVEVDVQLPAYKPDGRPNGTRTGRGLETRWALAPWVTTTPPTAPTGPNNGQSTAGAPPAGNSPASADVALDEPSLGVSSNTSTAPQEQDTSPAIDGPASADGGSLDPMPVAPSASENIPSGQ
jgi:KaiC/GvpD/RAD55 family RecA-like ATPase